MNNYLIFIFLILSTAIGQVMSDLYLPSMPAIQSSLSTSTHVIQLSVAFFMFGLSISQLIYGPVSDALGRKRPLLTGLIIAIIGTVLSMLAHTVYLFLLGRLLQGLGCGAGGAIARAMLRDVYHDRLLAKYSSYLSITGIFLMAGAPFVGGYIQQYAGWRFNFLALLIYAIITIIVLLWKIPETNQNLDMQHLKLPTIRTNLLTLFSNKNFTAYIVSLGLTYGGIIAWLTSGPFLIQTILGFSPITFGRVAFGVGVAYAIGGYVNSRLVSHHDTLTLLRVGFTLMLLAGIILTTSALFSLNIFILTFSVVIYVIGSSLVFPNSYAGSMQPFRKIAGLAGAFLGFAQVMGGAFFSSLISYAHDDNQIPLALVFLSVSVLGLLTSLLIQKPSRIEL